MRPFENISLVYKCDQATLARAAILAKENRAKLTLVYPVKELAGESKRLRVGEKSIDVGKLLRQEFQARLKWAADSVRSHGVRPATKLMVGDPSLEVIRDVIANRRDLVIMTAEGKRGLRQLLFGSTSLHLIRNCPVPLLVMKPGRQKRFDRILAAIDPEVTGGPRDTLNGTILELGMSLSAGEKADLHIVHAWTLLGESVLRGRGSLSAAELTRAIHEGTEKRRRSVENCLARYSVAGYLLHIRKGDPADVIPRAVVDLGIDLLIMGTVSRKGIPGLIIGNTAELVLDAVDCSVLVVKPEGFVSPVAPRIHAEGE